jgi:hypothetical protein
MIAVGYGVEERTDVVVGFEVLAPLADGLGIGEPPVLLHGQAEDSHVAGLGVRVAEVAQEFPDHEGELRIVEAKAEEDETLADPQILEGVVVDTRFIRLAVLAGVQNDPSGALPIAVDPEHRAVIVEDVTGAPAIDLLVVLPGRRAGAEALWPQLCAGELQRGIVVGRDVGAKGDVQQRGMGAV